MEQVAAECDHDHDGYATGYQHALDYVFEYVEHLALNAVGCRIRADELGQKFSKAHYMGEEAVLERLLEWLSEEDEDDDGDELKLVAGGG